MLHKAVKTSVDRRTGRTFCCFKLKKKDKLKGQEIQQRGKKQVREKEEQRLWHGGKQRRLLFIHRNRESTSFTVSHLSYKPLDPQGEWLSEGRRVAPSRTFTNPTAFSAAVTRLAALFFAVFLCLSQTRPHAHNGARRHASKHLHSATLISFPATVCFGRDSCGSVVRVQNSKVKICRWKSWPLNPLQRFYKPAFMHILSPRCCLQTLTKHIHLNCHTLHFCFPNCTIISHEWCSSLTQMPRNILHTEKLFKWAQINDGLSLFFCFFSMLYVTSCV